MWENMPPRSFFNFRYAVPGFTFLLFFVLILSSIVRSFLQLLTCTTTQVELVGFLLGLLTLLSGAAIGFLVSQFWYVIYNRYYKEQVYLKEAFGILEVLGVKKDLTTVIDYILHKLDDKDKGLKDYIDRRYDLFNLLGSTMSSIILVLFFYFLDLISKFFQLGLSLFKFFELGLSEIVIITAIFLLINIWLDFQAVVKENQSMLRIILKQNKGKLLDLPEDIISKENKQNLKDSLNEKNI